MCAAMAVAVHAEKSVGLALLGIARANDGDKGVWLAAMLLVLMPRRAWCSKLRLIVPMSIRTSGFWLLSFWLISRRAYGRGRVL